MTTPQRRGADRGHHDGVEPSYRVGRQRRLHGAFSISELLSRLFSPLRSLMPCPCNRFLRSFAARPVCWVEVVTQAVPWENARLHGTERRTRCQRPESPGSPAGHFALPTAVVGGPFRRPP